MCKISEFLCRVLLGPQSIKNWIILSGFFVAGAQLKWQNFERRESFWGLVHIPMMCLLYVSFVGNLQIWHYDPTKTRILHCMKSLVKNTLYWWQSFVHSFFAKRLWKQFASEDNHASTSSVTFLRAGCPSWHPTNSVRALKAIPAWTEQNFVTDFSLWQRSLRIAAEWLKQAWTPKQYEIGTDYILTYRAHM